MTRPGKSEIENGVPNLSARRATKRPLGPPLGLTAEQLDQAAEITPVDVAAARALWQSAAPPALAGLLDAALEDDDGG